ncbi:MAG TPA: ABC transporter substrate-binding protein [Casimicrobiaceae bacterium]|nr:ABC transporter substrate-binding protein [Casimicrobiaceae bacterium]
MRRAETFIAVALGWLALVAPAARATDPSHVLHVEFRVAETGFDPQFAYDSYSFRVIDSIFEAPYTYDYFARPAKLALRTAAGLPQITDGGRTYTVRIRPGIHFASDPAFGGKQRELTAADYLYSIRRHLDPQVRSYWLYLFENHLLGLGDVLARARKTGKLDYDAPIEGLTLVDRYTFRVRFTEPDYAFQHWLTTGQFGAVAREVVEKYGDAAGRVLDHPVGTGPYRLKSWTRGQKILLEANPDYRDERYPAPPPGNAEAAEAARGLVGKKLPLAGTVDISVLEEAQPRLLSFQQGNLDLLELPASLADNVLDGEALRPLYAHKGVKLHRQVDPAMSFYFFNMDDAVVGGYTPEKVALRRAIGLAFDRAAYIKTIANGQAVPATQLLPPSIPGYDASRKPLPYDPAGARALLDKFGYKDRDGDGFRETPDGKPLTITRGSTTDAAARSTDELWKRCMDAIGIRMVDLKQKWPELNKMSEAGQLQMWGLAWFATIPDPDQFFSPLYSKNIGTSNDARLRLPEYDRLFEQERRLPDSPERSALQRKMTDLVIAYAPWLLQTYTYDNVLTQAWVRGYDQHPFLRGQYSYYDVERPAR